MSRRNNSRGGGTWVGRTIAQEWERQESESERLAARKKNKTRKWVTVSTYLLGLVIVSFLIGMMVSEWVSPTEIAVETEKAQPTVSIIDESGAGVTNRMKEYVGQIEGDFKDIGYNVTRAVIPAGKTREIDIYLNGRDYYIKMSIDRGTAVSAEDSDRMIRYLDEREIQPEYVDVRVEGKGYYRERQVFVEPVLEEE